MAESEPTDAERHEMLLAALLTPQYTQAYHTNPRAKATLEAFARQVPLMLQGLMEQAEVYERTFQALRAVIDPQDEIADLVDGRCPVCRMSAGVHHVSCSQASEGDHLLDPGRHGW